MPKVLEVMKLSDLPLGSVIKFDADGLDVAIAHTEEGVFAIEDTCSHAEVSLAEGELNGCFLECWMHGSAFDLRTGIPKTPPAIKSVETFPVMIQGEGQDAVITIEMSA
jgi:3-phenylpropionate/trans-cinnamate dioxygenase ferredoxin subunit